MLGIDSRLVGSDQDHVRNSAGREVAAPPLELIRDLRRLRAWIRDDPAEIAIDRAHVLPSKIEPAVASHQHLVDGGNMKPDGQQPVMDEYQFVPAAQAIVEC